MGSPLRLRADSPIRSQHPCSVVQFGERLSMPRRVLRLLFDPEVHPDPDPEARDVLCCQIPTDSPLRGESLKEFCGDKYESLGREVGIDWLRRFSTPGVGGKSLHELFRWGDFSALWFTRHLFLYEDLGIFPRLLALVRSLRLLEQGVVERVELFGEPVGIRESFQRAGCDCRGQSPTGGGTNRRGPFSRMRAQGRGVFRRFFLSRRLRNRFSENHRPHQTDSLLYLVVQGEWLPGPGGGHRYLKDAVNELLEIGEASSARPIVYGIPPAFEDDAEWLEFLGTSLREEGGIYPMGYVTLADSIRIRSWVKRRMAHLKNWIAAAPDGFNRIGGFDVGPFIREALRDLPTQLERGLLQFLAFRKAFESIRPKGFLLKDEVYTHGRIALAAARSAGVPSAAFQHGTIYPTHWCYLMDRDATELNRPPLPDRFGVYGSAVQDLLTTQNGFPQEVVRVVGARRFRDLNRMTPSEEFLRLKGSGRPLVLIAGQLHQDMAAVYDWTFDLARENPHPIFIFKPHPRDRAGVDSIRERCDSFENARMFQGPIGDLLPAADLVVSCHSTVLLEAVWLGIGGVSVLVSGESGEDWRQQAGLIKIARTPEELEEIVRLCVSGELYSDDDRRRADEFLETFLGRSAVQNPDALSGFLREEPGRVLGD